LEGGGEDQAAVLNNLALCFENLGDLTAALKHQTSAMEISVTNGDLVAELMSLNNIAAIRTKSGQLREAETLFGQAQYRMRTHSSGNIFDKNSIHSTIEADTALNAIYRADYTCASDCIRNIPPSQKSFVDIDQLFCEIVRCKFLIEVGLHNL